MIISISGCATGSRYRRQSILDSSGNHLPLLAGRLDDNELFSSLSRTATRSLWRDKNASIIRVCCQQGR